SDAVARGDVRNVRPVSVIVVRGRRGADEIVERDRFGVELLVGRVDAGVEDAYPGPCSGHPGEIRAGTVDPEVAPGGVERERHPDVLFDPTDVRVVGESAD